MSDADTLEAWLDRRPMMLFPELEERRLAYRCEQRPDGSYAVRIAAQADASGAAR